MKAIHCLSLLLVAAFVTLPAAAAAQSAPSPDQTMTFSDGATARTFGHCGDMDLCGTITYANGDVLSIYSEGAAAGQPYTIHCVRTRGAQTIFEYSRLTDTAWRHVSQLTLDRGRVYMDISENSDGTISLAFLPRTQ